jgi:hypothetical protein
MSSTVRVKDGVLQHTEYAVQYCMYSTYGNDRQMTRRPDDQMIDDLGCQFIKMNERGETNTPLQSTSYWYEMLKCCVCDTGTRAVLYQVLEGSSYPITYQEQMRKRSSAIRSPVVGAK